jgi:hypothetical protein
MMASTPSGRDVLFCLGAGCGLVPPGCASAGAADMAAEAARNERRLKNGMADACSADACDDRVFRPRRTLPDCDGHRKHFGRHFSRQN